MRKGYGRIVNVTSHMGTFDEMGNRQRLLPRVESWVNALTCILAAELKDDGILVNAASPGKVDTRLAYGKAKSTPDEAAGTFVWLATLPSDGPSGGLFYQRRPLAW